MRLEHRWQVWALGRCGHLARPGAASAPPLAPPTSPDAPPPAVASGCSGVCGSARPRTGGSGTRKHACEGPGRKVLGGPQRASWGSTGGVLWDAPREGAGASPEGRPPRRASRRGRAGRPGPEGRSGAAPWPARSPGVRVGPFPPPPVRPGRVPPVPYPANAFGVRQQQLPQDLLQPGGLHGSSRAAATGSGWGRDSTWRP